MRWVNWRVSWVLLHGVQFLVVHLNGWDDGTSIVHLAVTRLEHGELVTLNAQWWTRNLELPWSEPLEICVDDEELPCVTRWGSCASRGLALGVRITATASSPYYVRWWGTLEESVLSSVGINSEWMQHQLQSLLPGLRTPWQRWCMQSRLTFQEWSWTEHGGRLLCGTSIIMIRTTAEKKIKNKNKNKREGKERIKDNQFNTEETRRGSSGSWASFQSKG